MELNFRLQRNEDTQLQKLFTKYKKRHNRRQIVEEMIEVRQANKQIVHERKVYKSRGALVLKENSLATWTPKSIQKAAYTAKKSYYSVHSIMLFLWYSVLDALEMLKRKRTVVAGVALSLVFLMICSFAYDRLFGYEVVFNGHTLGVARNVSDLKRAVRNSETRFAEWYKNDSLFFEHTITTKLMYIGGRKDVMNQKALEEAIIDTDIPVFANGAIITVDGVDAVRVASVPEAEYIIELIDTVGLDHPDDKGVKVIGVISNDVYQDLDITEKTVNLAEVRSTNEAIKYMNYLMETAHSSEAGNNVAASAEISRLSVNGNTDKISAIYGPNSENIGIVTALNFRQDEFAVGEITTKPILTMKTVRKVIYEDSIKYKTEYVNDSTMYSGQKKVQTKGVNGKKNVTAISTYINGKVFDKEILDEEVIVEPINEVVARGTKLSLAPVGAGTGKFIISTNGRITSFGNTRSGSHSGHRAVDIAAPYGTKIYAADGGRVSQASHSGGYGNCIIIQHENGYSTLYAHMSSFDVGVGDVVQQGDLIGRVGSTGKSTGPHLHFEIRYKNKQLDLRDYFTFKEGQTLKAGESGN